MIELIAKLRDHHGKKANITRKAGLVPAVLYGYGTKPQPLSVDNILFEKVWRNAGESSVITLSIEGGKSFNVLIQEVALHPVRDVPVHVDFHAIQMDKPIEATVSLSFVDESDAVKTLGGVLVRVIGEVEVRALPKDLPHEIEVSITSLNTFEDQILIKDLSVPKDVTILTNHDQVVALVEAPRTEAELASLNEVPVDTSLDDIEITKKKPDEASDESSEEQQ